MRLSAFLRRLVFLWIIGLVAGVLVCVYFHDVLSQLHISFLTTKPSVLGMLVVGFLPVMLSLICIQTDLRLPNSVIILIDSICRGFCSFFIYLHYGSGAWLLRMMLMHLAIVSDILIWWFVLRYHIYGKVRFSRDVPIAMTILVGCMIADHFWVLPLLTQLSIYF